MASSEVNLNEMQVFGRIASRPLLLLMTLSSLWHVNQEVLPFAGGSDSSAYLHEARLLIEGRLFGDVRQIGDILNAELAKGVYQPLGFLVQDGYAKQSPAYPFGFPLLLTLFDIFLETELSVWVALLATAALAPFGVYARSRRMGLSAWWSLFTVAVTIGGPVDNFMAFNAMSDFYCTLPLGCLVCLGDFEEL